VTASSERPRPEIDAETYKTAFQLAQDGKVEEAIAVYRLWAKRGSTIAQNALAALLDDQLVPPRHKEAVYWFRRAVNQGSTIAAWNLAMHYKNRDKDRWYLFWLGKAAALGDDEAEETLEIERAFRHAGMRHVPPRNMAD
jgi:TPR repeat protein